MGTTAGAALSVIGIVIACAISLVAIAGIAIAMAFFIGMVGYGWMRTIAPKEELEALPPERRRWVTVRAGIGAAILWVLLLAASNDSHRGRNMSGDEVFAFFYRWLRRFAGLPPEPPPSVTGDAGPEAEAKADGRA